MRHRAREQRLRAPGRALDEHVPVCERGDEEQFDSVILPDDDLAHLVLRDLAKLAHAVEARLVGARSQDAQVVVRRRACSRAPF